MNDNRGTESMLCDHETLIRELGETMLVERVPTYLIAPTPGDRADAVSVKIGSHYFEFDIEAAKALMVGLGHAIHEREAMDCGADAGGDGDEF